MRRIHFIGLAALAVLVAGSGAGGGYYWHKRLSPEALDLRGAQLMVNCRRCHAIEPGLANTGPTLIGIWNRQAGTVAGFERYSPALRASNVVWNAESLDRWLTDPQVFIPGTLMNTGAIADARDRRILIRFLERANTGAVALESALGRGDYGHPPAPHSAGHLIPGMGGRVSNEHLPLQDIPPERQVRAISLCRDTYQVTLGDGTSVRFWEPNIRFKTDSSANGPRPGAPAILPTSSLGDRVTVIFANPGEISRTIQAKCESAPLANARSRR